MQAHKGSEKAEQISCFTHSFTYTGSKPKDFTLKTYKTAEKNKSKCLFFLMTANSLKILKSGLLEM